MPTKKSTFCPIQGLKTTLCATNRFANAAFCSKARFNYFCRALPTVSDRDPITEQKTRELVHRALASMPTIIYRIMPEQYVVEHPRRGQALHDQRYLITRLSIAPEQSGLISASRDASYVQVKTNASDFNGKKI